MKRLLKLTPKLWSEVIKKAPPLRPEDMEYSSDGTEGYTSDSSEEMDIEMVPGYNSIKKKTKKKGKQREESPEYDPRRRVGIRFSDLPYPEWVELNNQAEYSILGGVIEKYHSSLQRCRNARHMWQKLEKTFNKQTLETLSHVQEQYTFCRQKRGEPIQSYLSNLERVTQRLESLGERIPRRQRIIKLLNGLEPAFQDFGDLLRQLDGLTYDDCVGRLQNHEAQQLRRRGSGWRSNARANFTDYSGGQTWDRVGWGREGWGGGETSNQGAARNQFNGEVLDQEEGANMVRGQPSWRGGRGGDRGG